MDTVRVKIEEMEIDYKGRTILVSGEVEVDWKDPSDPEITLVKFFSTDDFVEDGRYIKSKDILKFMDDFDFNKLKQDDQDWILGEARDQLV